jgi:Fusaric acid resistance protein family
MELSGKHARMGGPPGVPFCMIKAAASIIPRHSPAWYAAFKSVGPLPSRVLQIGNQCFTLSASSATELADHKRTGIKSK